jgi:hypothetical protein
VYESDDDDAATGLHTIAGTGAPECFGDCAMQKLNGWENEVSLTHRCWCPSSKEPAKGKPTRTGFVKKEGANLGRPYVCCVRPKEEGGCGFFQMLDKDVRLPTFPLLASQAWNALNQPFWAKDEEEKTKLSFWIKGVHKKLETLKEQYKKEHPRPLPPSKQPKKK